MIFCFVLPSFIKDAKGGSEIQTFLLAQEFLKKGWEVHYIREKNLVSESQEKIDGMMVHSLPRRHTKLKWLNIRSLLQIMRKIQADVWYCRGTISYVFPVWFCARKVKGQVIWACSSDRFLSKQITKELMHESFLRQIASYIDRRLFWKTLKKIDRVVLQSMEQKRMLEENWKLNGTVIYNGLQISSSQETQREPLILWIGRLQAIKHPERFVQLAEKLKKRPYEFVVMGREVEKLGYRESLLQMESENSNFKYLGELEREDVFKWLQKAKLLVNTSDYEGFSNTFIEAWMHGVPVVSLKADPDDMIKQNNLGYASLNMKQLVKDVDGIMQNENFWKDTSARCRAHAEENFSIEQKADEVENLLRKRLND